MISTNQFPGSRRGRPRRYGTGDGDGRDNHADMPT